MGKDRDPGDQQEHPPTAQPSAVSPAPSSHPRDPKMQAARVRLPDGVYKEFEVNRSSEGEALFQLVTRDLSIEEREYFSLCFYDKAEGTRHWLYNDKKILRQLKGLPWEFSFEVKFYPTTPTTLVDDHARYYLFLQLRRDILTERLPATADTHALLGSFVAQIEYRDSPSQIGDDYEKFIVESKLVPASQANPEMYKKIAELHRELRGQTTSEAENLFLDHCKHLALYGIHLFKAMDKDKKPVDIGVGAAGVNIYQDDQKIHSFNWQNIVKIGYKRSYFSVKLKSGTLGKDEKTLYYKLATHLASKRAWKCAVEHHTFFRLIQPEDKPQKSFFNFGSQRFRYQGRTQFQTKMASQMFDRPSNVDRAPSSMSQPITSTEEQKLNTLNLTDSELEQRTFERYRRALTPKSYTRDDDAISSATFAKYSRPTTLLVSTSSAASPHDHDLSYSPRGFDDSNLSSAAYYMSERSSLRTPSSAYYPPSEYAASSASQMQSPSGEESSHYYEGQYRGEYHVQMRQQTASSSGGARRNLFGRASDTSRDSVRLVSFHEPVDPDRPIPNTYPVNELPQIPIERIVQVYHEGHYDRLSPRREQRQELPYGFGNYTPRNGVSHVDRLEPHGEMDQQPIRFFVDVRHSGASRRDPAKRLSHPGKEDVKDQVDLKDYVFREDFASAPLHRTELNRDVQPANIQQYTRRYHHGDSQKLNEPSTSTAPRYRLITHVQPLVVSHHQRDGRNGQQSSSNVNATISQREQVVSTKVRRESPDADRRVRLSASVDRSGNVTDTTEEMAKSATSTSEVTTTTTVTEKKVKKQKIPPTSSASSKKTKVVEQETQSAEPSATLTQESRSRFGGFFKKSSKTSKDSDAHKETTTDVAPAEQKTYRLITRFRHEGDEDVVEKPDAYGFASVAHESPVEEISRSEEIVEAPLEHHATQYHHGESSTSTAVTVVTTTEKKQKKSPKKEKKVKAVAEKSPKKEKVVEPEEPEIKEVRLIARVRSEPDEETATESDVKEKKSKKEISKSRLPTFGFLSRSNKTIKTSQYPESSEHFSGELDTTDRSHDLESHPFEHVRTPSPHDLEEPSVAHREEKKGYNLFTRFARFRHDGAEDVVEKPDAYAFASTSYDGPLDETSRQAEIDQLPIGQHSSVYHHGESWRVERPTVSTSSTEKKVKSPKKVKEVKPVAVKSPKKAKIVEPVEPETREVRLIARVRTEPEEGPSTEPAAAEQKPKKEGSSIPALSFFRRSSKTTKTSGYPESEQFTGELDTTGRSNDLESSPLEHRDIPAYSPKKLVVAETPEVPEVHQETRLYRLFARFRHEGDEDEVEKPDAYAFASTVYEGPLDETSRVGELDHAPIADHATVYHHGDSTKKEEPKPVVALEKKQKKMKSPKKKKVAEPVEPEIKEVRLIARVRTEPEEELPAAEPVVAEKKSKKEKSKSKLPSFGFFHRTQTPSTSHPETSDGYTGPVDTTDRALDIDTVPFEHGEIPEYSPKKAVAVAEAPRVEKKRYRLIARFRHDGEEDEVEKPDAYAFASTSYDGPLDETSRVGELDHAPIADHATVYHHGDSSKKDEPTPVVATLEKKQKKVKSPKKEKVVKPVEPETREVRLIARVRNEPEEGPSAEPAVVEKKPKKESSKSKLPAFGFFSRSTKTTRTSDYPESEQFSGELDTTVRSEDLDNSPFEHGDIPAYSPKKLVAAETPEVPEVHQETRLYRLIARFRHEGDEDEVEKPDAYAFASTVYDGPLDETARVGELDHAPIADHATVYHHGDSSKKEEPKPVVATLEKKQKKIKSPKKEKVLEPVEPETREVRLIARVRTEPEDESSTEPVVTEKKPKKESSKSKLPAFGFFSRSTKTTKSSGYPESEQFTGDLDITDRSHDLESSPFEHKDIPAYSPKKSEAYQPAVPTVERKTYRLIARFRHEGDEDEVESTKLRPEAYGFASTSYDGPLETTSLERDLEHSALEGHSTVYHQGESWKTEQKPISPAGTVEKKEKKLKVKKEKIAEPIEPEVTTVRLIARVPPHEEQSEEDVKSPRTSSSKSTFGFLKRSAKTKTSSYPAPSEQFTGTSDETMRAKDLERLPFEHEETSVQSTRVISAADPVVHHEKKRYRLIARFRHDGDEDVVDKPDPYAFSSTSYDGPLEETSRVGELEHAPIADHSAVYHQGESWIVEKPTSSLPKKVKAKKEKALEPAVEESKPTKLIVYVKPQQPEVSDEADVVEKKPKKEGSKSKPSSFGFFSRSSKTTKASGYPESSELFTGELDTTVRSDDLENSPFESGDIPAYSPKKLVVAETPEVPAVQQEKKLYRLIARFRHEGDEDEVEKPDAYAFASTAYEGPLDETSRVGELDHTPIADHATVYHHGDSSKKDEPTPVVATLEKKQKKVKSPKKEKVVKPVEPETREVRLIARVRTEPEEEPSAEPVVAEKKPKKESSKSKLPAFGFFTRSTKTTKTSGYPESEQFTGELDTTVRRDDLENSPFEHGDIPAYSPKKLVVAQTPEVPEVHQETRLYRLIARFRHEGDEDEVEKPNAYAFATTVYEGPLDETARVGELDHTPIADHATVYHHGDSTRTEEPKPVVATLEKKQKKIKSPKKEKVAESVEPETREVRLIARVRTEPEDESSTEPVVTEKKPKKESSKSKLPAFGFFSRSTKTTKTSGYPESEQFTGELDTTVRSHDLENSPLEHGDIPTYSLKKLVVAETPEEPEVHQETRLYRLIARFRHDGDEDEVEKPDAYAFASTVYEGPLDETSRVGELDHAPIADHATVYHHGDSSKKEEPKPVVATLEKKQKKVKSPKKEKVVEPVEPETREVRLIARVRTEPEEELSAAEPVVSEKKSKKEKSKSKLPSFGFFHRTQTSSTTHTETSDGYTGPVDTTDRSLDIETVPFEHGEIPEYSPKKAVAVAEAPRVEKKRYRLIARFRHDGDEDEVEKPDAYAFASTSYDGPLDETARVGELDHAPIADHATVYHHGDSSKKEEPTPVVATLEKKQKKVKSPKKEKVVEPVEPESREVRLIARIRTEPEEEPSAEPAVVEKKPKKESSKSKLPAFGFFSRSTKTAKTSGYPESEQFTGELDTTVRSEDLDASPFEHGDIPAYSPKKLVVAETPEVPAVQQETRLYRLIARFRHEGDEDEVEKPDAYAFASTVYEGPLDETARVGELDHAPIADHATVHHHGDSSKKEEPTPVVATLEKKQKKVKSPKKEKEQEKNEAVVPLVRLIARVKSEPEDADDKETPVVKDKKPRTGTTKQGFFSRSTKTAKTSGYPKSSEQYTGDLEITGLSQDLDASPFERGDIPAYSPKKLVISKTPEVPEVHQETRLYRLIARFRHEGDEDVVEKPDAYAFATAVYEGPLDETSRVGELDHTPIADHATVYHHGDSSKKEEPKPVVATLEKKQKKVKSPKKEKVAEPVEPETREVRLIARVRTEPEEGPSAEPAVVEKKPKKESSKSKLPAFGFFSRSTKTAKTSGYPESEQFTGELDTTVRSKDLDASPFEHGDIPTYSPKKLVVAETPEVPEVHQETRLYRLIARFRHEGGEDEVEKPDAYAFASTVYEGPLDETSRVGELDHAPIADHATVYHHGDSSKKEEPKPVVATLEKKQKKVKSPKKEKVAEPVEPEIKEVRLIARVRTENEDESSTEPVVSEKTSKKRGAKLPAFGFLDRSNKKTTTSGYPQTSEQFAGDLDTTARSQELENSPFEHGEIPAYSPKQLVVEEAPDAPVVLQEKKKYRLIARFQHEGEEDVVEKPEFYAFPPEAYDGPLDETARVGELDHSPIADHATVYHRGDSSKKEEPKPVVATLEKKQKKVKSPKKEKVVEPVEPETREVRLIALIRTEPEEEPSAEPVVVEKKPKKLSSKSKLPAFGFFRRSSKTTKASEYPETSEQFTGELDTTVRSEDLDNTPFEHGDIPAYSPKKLVAAETPEVPEVHQETRLYRLIARFRHEGDEDEVEKPNAYAFATTVYEGPLDETARVGELDHTPIADHATVYHHGDSSKKEEPKPAVATLEKKQKKVKSPKKEKVVEPVEPETREVRLIARIRTEPEEEPSAEPVVAEKKPKKESSKSKLPAFGFFSRSTKTTKTSGYPESEQFTGELDTTVRSEDLDNTPFEHGDIPAYSPKKLVAAETPEVPEVHQETRLYRLIARFRHEGDEDEVEKPNAYAFATTVYEGPLDETARVGELDHTPIADHATVYHHGDSSKKEEPKPAVATLEKKQKKVKSPKKEKVVEPVEPETREVRLIARIRTEPEEEPSAEPVVAEKKPKKESSKSKLPAFGFFSRSTKTTKTSGYPESEQFTGELATTVRSDDLENSPFEHGDIPAYSPKKLVVAETPTEKPEVHQETRLYRLIARFRHEGDEDEVEKPDAYAFASTVYEGPLDETARVGELDHSPIADHATVYHRGDSSKKEELKPVVATLEKKQKKVKSPKKEKVAEPVEPETREVRLIARVRNEPEEESSAEPAVVEKKPKKEGSNSKLPNFGFFSRSIKATKGSGYPELSEQFTGDLDVTGRDQDLESSPFEHREIPVYSPRTTIDEKKSEAIASTAEPEEPVQQQVRLIARVPVEQEEPTVEPIKQKKPVKEGTRFGFFSRSRTSKTEIPVEPTYEGPLDTTIRSDDLENLPFEHSATPVPVVEEQTVEAAEPTVHEEKKRFRWFARFRHEGDEDVVEKPDAYNFTKDVYDGPLSYIAPDADVDQTPIADHSTVYHHGESWRKEKPVSPAAEKKQKKIKVAKSETPEPETSPEVRLVARIQPLVTETEDVPEEKASPTKHRSRTSSFNIFHRQSKTTGYPEATPIYEGHLDTTGRAQEVDSSPLEQRDYPEYSPKKAEVPEPVVQQRESRIYRLIARFRHEGEEDVVEKPNAYAFASTVYEGPLDEVAKQTELAESPINDFSTVYHHGESWRKDVAVTPVSTTEKKQKKAKSAKKEKIVEPVEPEKTEVRLLARVRSEEPAEDQPEDEGVSPRKDDSSRPFRLRFFSLTPKQKPAATGAYPETSPTYEGPLDVTGRSDDLEKMPYLHGEVPRYSPKPAPRALSMSTEKKTGLFSRFRHGGDEDVVEKPEGYRFDSTLYEGPLNDISRQEELAETPLGEHATVYHHGESLRKEKAAAAPEKKSKKKVVEEPEVNIRLVARVPPHEQDPSSSETSAEKSPRKDEKESKPFRLRFFSLSNRGSSDAQRLSKYPEVQPIYEGPLEVTDHSPQLEQVPIEVREFPAYSPKKAVEPETSTAPDTAPVVEKKLYRLIARFRHEGDEDEVEKPDAYQFASVVYDGPLEDIRRQEELDQALIGDHSAVYHSGESWKSETPLKSKKVRLSTDVEQQVPEAAENNENVPPKASRFSFLRGVKPNRSARATSYPSTSENYTGPLDVTDRNADLERIPLEQSVTRPKHSPRKPTELSPEVERKYRLIARFRHEGHEDEVDKSNLQPVFYGFPDYVYSGKYEPSPFLKEVEEYPLRDFTAAYHHGHSGSKLRQAIMPIMSKLTKDKRTSGAYQETKPDVKLIARVLPMQKQKAPVAQIAPELPPSDDEKPAEPLTRSTELEERAMTDIVGPSTSTTRNTALVVENTVNYFPSSLQYEPRAARIEGFTGDGHGYVEVRLERRAEVQLEPVYLLRETTRSHAYLSTATTYFSGASASAETSTSHSVVPFVGSVSEDETGLHFSSTPNMSPPERPSLLARFGFKRDKNKKKDKKKGKKENESSETSDSEHDEKREFAVVEFQPTHDEKKSSQPAPPQEGPKKPEHRTHKSPGRRTDEPMNEVTVVVTGGETRPAELGNTKEVRHETREQQFRLTGDGYTSGFNPNDPSLMATIQRAERLNASSPRLEHAERTFTVRANAPLPVSFEESGQPYTTVSTWQETSDLPEQVEVYTDENGRQITRTVKSSQVKHTVQTQSFQNYIVDGDQVPVGVVDVERSREQLTPLGQRASSSENGGDAGIVETQTRTMTYEAQGSNNGAAPAWGEDGLGEYVSSKSVTQGNRTIETITYKTEKDGIVETHVEHRVTIHSDGDIDHDAELTQAIKEATQMNPDMQVEKIEVRQETQQ